MPHTAWLSNPGGLEAAEQAYPRERRAAVTPKRNMKSPAYPAGLLLHEKARVVGQP